MLLPLVMLVFLVTAVSAFTAYYWMFVARKPRLIVKQGSKLQHFLQAHVPMLEEKFFPSFWCFGSHSQSVVANMIRSRVPDIPCDREYIPLDDGGQVSLDWYKDSAEDERKPLSKKSIAIIVPGLTGCSQTEYVKSLVPCLQASGYVCAGFNQRSRGGMRLLTPRLYCAANCDDLAHALSLIREKNPDSLIVALGISLGGIQLTRYLIKSGRDSKVDASVIMSTVFDLLKANAGLEKLGMNRVFNGFLTNSLLTILKEEKDMFAKHESIDVAHVMESKVLRELDGRFTAKMFGYASAEDYYVAASNRGMLHEIRVPTVFLSSGDDFMSREEILPLEEISRCDHVAMILAAAGGHIGFMEGVAPKLPFYSERIVSQYLNAFRGHHDAS